jgi:hypothetical protein
LSKPESAPRALANKDHLKSKLGRLFLASTSEAALETTQPLAFWTRNPLKPYLVDLSEFADGISEDEDRIAAPYRGRPELIEQLLPAFKARHILAAPRTIDTIKSGLRKWWRLFDSIEANEALELKPGAIVQRVSSVLALGPLHGSQALQSGMSRNDFNSFVVLADITLLALGTKRRLHWPSPSKRLRQMAIVPPSEDVKSLYHGIKDDWHGAKHRWSIADGLVAGVENGGFRAGESRDAMYLLKEYESCSYRHEEGDCEEQRQRYLRQREHERLLLAGLLHWRNVSDRVGSVDLERRSFKRASFSENTGRSLGVARVAEAMYPNGTDIRSAFHLCLAVGGLNVSVLTQLRLDLRAGLELPAHHSGLAVDETLRRSWVLKRCPFLVESPVDGEYYVEGWKDRSKSWISRTYKWKQQLTPGPILIELIIRTWPLRLALIKRLSAAKKALQEAYDRREQEVEINTLKKAVHEFESGVISPWIYRGARGICWLDDTDYHAAKADQSYLDLVIERTNEKRRAQGAPEVVPMDLRRFRDAYAAWALNISGGEVLAVMVALDHRRLATTGIYLENTAIRSRVLKKYRIFSNALFASLGNGNLDPTRIALETRYAEADEERSRMSARLFEYRAAVKSRYGIGCRNPTKPSKQADPIFESDGIKMCSTHRCMLCKDNAIITPEAYPGLMLRQAELEIIEEQTPVASFKFSLLDAEISNTRAALLPFKETQPDVMASTIDGYKKEIRDGRRRIPGFALAMLAGENVKPP